MSSATWTLPILLKGRAWFLWLNDTTTKVHESAVSQYYRTYQQQELMGYSMRTERYRYVEWRDFSTGELASRELYDHDVDKRESKNLIADVSEELGKELANRLNKTHPQRELSMTPAIHSSPSRGRFPTKLVFRNEHESEIIVYPITPNGRRGRQGLIAPTKELEMNARIGGVFVVESRDGKVHEIHSPNWPSKTIVIR